MIQYRQSWDKIKQYLRHDKKCILNTWAAAVNDDIVCSCGLSDLVREFDGYFGAGTDSEDVEVSGTLD